MVSAWERWPWLPAPVRAFGLRDTSLEVHEAPTQGAALHPRLKVRAGGADGEAVGVCHGVVGGPYGLKGCNTPST